MSRIQYGACSALKKCMAGTGPGHDASISRLLASGVETGQSAPVAQNDPPRRRQRNGRLRLELGQRARDRLDGEAEIIGDVLARHRHLDLLGRGALGQVEQERCYALLRALGEKQHALLHAAQFTRGKGPKPARDVSVGVGERHQRAALYDKDRRFGDGFGRKVMLVVHLETEYVPRQIEGFVDFVKHELRISRRVDVYGEESPPKSIAGVRTLPLSDQLVAMLKTWRLKSRFSKMDDLIFPNWSGRYVGHDNMIKRQFLPLFNEVKGVNRFNWHGLRHFAVSCWIEAGLAAKTVQTFAGHASLQVTMDRYGHLFPSDDHRKAMDQIATGLFA